MITLIKKYRRFIASFLLLSMLQQTIGSSLVHALSTGPEQVEYASYESSGSSDMVNLLTGDFSYTMPVLDVPGPEGSFPLPLFYHAGITLEQDASWVGLGWNMNPGCITRNVVGYADDAYDQSQSVNVTDPGGRGYVNNYVFYKRSWDSEKGYGGAISLFDIVGVEWNNSSGLKSGTLIGLNFNKSGVRGDVAENVMNVSRVIFTIATMAAGSAASAGATAKVTAMDVAMTAVQVGSTLFQGYLSQGTFTSKYFNWDKSVDVSHLGFRTDYKYWLDDTREERGFGSLYLGSTHLSSISSTWAGSNPYNMTGTEWPRIYTPGPVSSYPIVAGFKRDAFPGPATASDMYTYVGPGYTYGGHYGPSHISYDNFNVMTQGVSGSIAPYRLEIGSLAQPKRLAFRNDSHNIAPFLQEDNDLNKVQFYYPGQFANKYLHHDDSDFGITTSVRTEDGKKCLFYEFTSDKLQNNRFEPDNNRINGKKIVSGKNVEWYSNEQIISGSAGLLGFIDTTVPRLSTVPKGIGGFSITKEDGLTYHYALPVYNTRQVELIGKKGEEEAKYSRFVNDTPVAISWLLTGITGADFVDRGQPGLLDDEDWGYWVKLDYGRTSSDYDYRIPYTGYFDDGTTLSYSQGKREQYYLNTIETRSHKAVFIKGVRTDGLSSYLKRNDPNYGHPTESGLPTPTLPLFLDEIVLLRKSDFNDLTNLGFNAQVNSSMGYSGLLGNNGTLAKVYDLADVQANTAYRTFIDSKALRRIKFVYETDETKKLCKKTLNSFADPGNPPAVDALDIYAGKQGKLTLKRVQFYGRNSVKVFPDYKFDYANNPDYNQHDWDGWGYYTPDGSFTTTSHKASTIDSHGAAWSLTNIVMPTGGEITVSYERDSYASISGEKILDDFHYYQASTAYNMLFTGQSSSLGELKMHNADQYFSVGDQVKLSGTAYYSCGSTSAPAQSYSGTFTIASINSTGMNLAANYMNLGYCITPGSEVTITSNNGTICKVIKTKKGGDIRVGALSYKNEFNEVLKTKYTYLNADGTTSSGVVSKEPQFIKSTSNTDNYGLDNLYDVPSTPVLYSRVTVHSQNRQGTESYGTKTVYEFETPHKNLVTQQSTQITNAVLDGFKAISSNDILFANTVYLRHYLHKLSIKNSRIGKIKSIKTTDANDVLSQSIDFTYTETPPNDQGKFTSGSILAEFTSLDGVNDPHAFRLLRTVKTYVPYALTKITTSKDGFTESKEYKSWDLLTGIPLVTDSKSAAGTRLREEHVPAYTVYPSMGLKGFNIQNKNMVSQLAAVYTYGLDESANILGLAGASVTRWKGDWANYRSYNQTLDKYEDVAEGGNVWRKHQTFSWLGDYARLRTDGLHTFALSDKFNFATTSNPRWKQLAETRRYDHYSAPLQTTEVFSGELSASQKMGHNNSMLLATAQNATYEEFAFSSAEDLQANNYFGGEVKKGAGTVSTTAAHTGSAALSAQGNAFIYRASLPAGKRYRASVWTNSESGRIYYTVNGAETLSAAPTTQKKVGNWYLLETEIPAQSASFALEVGVRSVSTAVLFDDFRFQPSTASLTGYVYDPTTGALRYILDNDNLFTRYDYDDSGQVIRTSMESIKYQGVKTISESSSNYRRFYIDQ